MLSTLSPIHVRWLSLLGYPVAGTSEEEREAWFEGEARQWEMTPQELQRLIDDLYEPYWTALHCAQVDVAAEPTASKAA